jgi:hypothetical protein
MSLAALLSTALAALAGLAGPAGEPLQPIVGAQFAIDVRSTTTGGPRSHRGVAAAKVAGTVDVAVTDPIRLSGSFRPPGTAARTYGAEIRTWRLDVTAGRTELVLRFRVAVTSDPSRCPVGARGVLRAVDDDARLDSGRSSDSVGVSFARRACRDFVRTWSNGPASGRSARARVEIDVETAEPSRIPGGA